MAIRAPFFIQHFLQGDGVATVITFDLKIFKGFPIDLTLVSPASVTAKDTTSSGSIAITAANTGTSVTLTFASTFSDRRMIELDLLF